MTRAELELLTEQEPWIWETYELIEGQPIDRRGKKRPHAIALHSIRIWPAENFGWKRVEQGSPIDVAAYDNETSEPVPDAIVLRRDSSEFPLLNPGPADLAMVLEVSDSTLELDLGIKAGLYARAGIEEYWVMDLEARALIVHRQPQGGSYSSAVTLGESESIAPLAAPGEPFPVRVAFR